MTPTPDARGRPADLVRRGEASAVGPTRARIPPKADQAHGGPAPEDAAVAEASGVGLRAIGRVRGRLVGGGLDDGLPRNTQDPPSRVRAPRRDRRGETDRPGVLGPAGRPCRVGRAVAGRRAGRTEGGGRDLRRDRSPGRGENAVGPWVEEEWCIPAGPGGALVAAVEDVIEVCHRPHDPRRPVACLDVPPLRSIGEARAPIPGPPGQPRRSDPEHQRNGTASRFPALAPRAGWRHVGGAGRRTAEDCRVAAWESARTERPVEAEWRFTTADARAKLHRRYPSTRA